MGCSSPCKADQPKARLAARMKSSKTWRCVLKATRIATALSLAVLGGCVTQPEQPDIPASQVAPTPTCSSPEQCSRMWSRAIGAAETVTRMRVMIANDTIIQTFPTRQIGFLNGRVVKENLGDGRYEIKGSFDCQPYSWCSNLLNRSQNLFNMMVTSSES